MEPIELTTLLLIAVPAFLLGLLLGFLIFGQRRARAALAEELEERSTEIARLQDRNEELTRELAMARDQIAPLADEVDRLRAMKTRVPPPETSTAAAAPVTREERGLAPQPQEKLPAFLDKKPKDPDDLSLLKGVGPKMETMLHDMGVWFYAQIADWSDEDVRAADAKLDKFKGRIERDQLIEQAKLLAAGRVTEYEARFGKLGPAAGGAA